MLEYVTHPNHPGVRAPMRQQEALDRHIEGGWELEKGSTQNPDKMGIKEYKLALDGYMIPFAKNARLPAVKKLYDDFMAEQAKEEDNEEE